MLGIQSYAYFLSPDLNPIFIFNVRSVISLWTIWFSPETSIKCCIVPNLVVSKRDAMQLSKWSAWSPVTWKPR